MSKPADPNKPNNLNKPNANPNTGTADWRLVPSALVAWAVTILVPEIPLWTSVSLIVVLALAATVSGLHARRHHHRLSAAVALAALVGTVVAVIALVHVALAWSGPLPALAKRAATVRAVVQIAADPLVRESTFTHGSASPDTYVVVRARVVEVTSNGVVVNVRTPVVVTAPPSWRKVVPGERLAVIGRLSATEPGDDVVAVLSVRGSPKVVGDPSPLMRAAQHLRDGLSESVQHLPPDQRALVPALVDGDVSQFPPDLQAAFKATGMTHLSAVSGTNLSILLALVLALGKPLGIRGRGALILGLATVVFFVVLARPQPSVLRAAAMGTVVVIGSVFGFRRGGLPALAIAVTTVLLVDPWLGRSYGFALSVLATGGLVLLAPKLADAMADWARPTFATAVSVPLAAQLTTMPVIAAISASISLVAIPANLLAEPAVAPATVLGVGLTVLAAIWPAAASVAAWLPFLPAWWIAGVARVGATLPGRAIPLAPGAGPPGAGSPGDSAAAGAAAPGEAIGPFILALVVLATIGLIAAAPRFLRSRRITLSAALGAVLILLTPPAWVLRPIAGIGSTLSGWPPDDWRIAACDVGQGDALVLRAGPRSAVVVDTGPEPEPVRRCLDRLGVDDVPYVLLTHFHADHVGGLAGVVAGRRVGAIGVTRPTDVPPVGSAATRIADEKSIPVLVARLGETQRAGEVTWQTLWPDGQLVTEDGREVSSEGSDENDSSVVWRATVGDISVLMTGDVEPEAQAKILRRYGGALAVDVLKVPHHGSRYQDQRFLAAARPRVALICVGAGNDYGHPNAGTIAALTATGARVARTDLDGATVVAGNRDHLRVVTRRNAN